MNVVYFIFLIYLFLVIKVSGGGVMGYSVFFTFFIIDLLIY